MISSLHNYPSIQLPVESDHLTGMAPATATAAAGGIGSGEEGMQLTRSPRQLTQEAIEEAQEEIFEEQNSLKDKDKGSFSSLPTDEMAFMGTNLSNLNDALDTEEEDEEKKLKYPSPLQSNNKQQITSQITIDETTKTFDPPPAQATKTKTNTTDDDDSLILVTNENGLNESKEDEARADVKRVHSLTSISGDRSVRNSDASPEQISSSPSSYEMYANLLTNYGSAIRTSDSQNRRA